MNDEQWMVADTGEVGEVGEDDDKELIIQGRVRVSKPSVEFAFQRFSSDPVVTSFFCPFQRFSLRDVGPLELLELLHQI